MYTFRIFAVVLLLGLAALGVWNVVATTPETPVAPAEQTVTPASAEPSVAGSPQEQTAPSAAPPSDADLSPASSAATSQAAGAHERETSSTAPDKDEAVITGTIAKGDTITKILDGASTGDVQPLVAAARRVFSLRALRTGQPYVVITDAETGRVRRFEYEIDSHRRLIVEDEGKIQARVEAIDYTVLLSAMSAVIDDSLFQAVADMGESPQLAVRLVDLFGSEINFLRGLADGDSFAVLVEKRYRNGEYKGYGRILAAWFKNRGKTYEAFLFRDGNRPARYYNRKGENLHKTRLQAPLAVTRITSRFSKNRMHPILGYSRPHEGVDYGAPTGTPVKAVGDGHVTFRGWAGGYGNQIILRHSDGLESLYSHLSGFARGLTNGQRVRQGQVIGFVGSTGLSTGPHLDFRLRKDGKFLNPSTTINPRGEGVSPHNMAAFRRTMEMELAYLARQRPFSEYDPNSLLSLMPTQVVQEKRHGATAEKAHKAERTRNTATSRRSRAVGQAQKTGKVRKSSRSAHTRSENKHGKKQGRHRHTRRTAR